MAIAWPPRWPGDVEEGLHAPARLLAERHEQELRRRPVERIAERAVGALHEERRGEAPVAHEPDAAEQQQRRQHGEGQHEIRSAGAATARARAAPRATATFSTKYTLPKKPPRSSFGTCAPRRST